MSSHGPLLYKDHDGPDRIHFGVGGRVGLYVALAAVVPAGLAWLGSGLDRWFWAFAAGMLVVFGLHLFLYRVALALDLASGSWAYSEGYVPHLQRVSGPLSELGHVLLKSQWTRDSSRSRAETLSWDVFLAFPEDGIGAVQVLHTRDEAEAYRDAEGLARRLGIPLVDETGRKRRVVEPEELDRTLGETAGAGAPAPAEVPAESRPRAPGLPPAGSKIDVRTDGEGRRTVFVRGTLVGRMLGCLGLVGLVLAAFVLLTLTGGLGTWEGNPLGMAVAGLVIFALGTAGARAGYRIVDEGSELVVQLRCLGMSLSETRLEKARIEDVEAVEGGRRTGEAPTPSTAERLAGSLAFLEPASRIGARTDQPRNDASRPREPREPPSRLRIRSHDQVVRVGHALTAEELIWLRDAVRHMVTS